MFVLRRVDDNFIGEVGLSKMKLLHISREAHIRQQTEILEIKSDTEGTYQHHPALNGAAHLRMWIIHHIHE